MCVSSGDSGAGGGCSYDVHMYTYSVLMVMQILIQLVKPQSWQSDPVSSYLQNESKLPNSDQYNATGRAHGYPDISA